MYFLHLDTKIDLTFLSCIHPRRDWYLTYCSDS